jgi:hypothetical protein
LSYRPPDRTVPATITLILSVLCITILVLLIHDRWNHPEIKSAEQAEHSTTGAATRDAGARLQPTDPKLTVEPTPPGPSPVQPAIPD